MSVAPAAKSSLVQEEESKSKDEIKRNSESHVSFDTVKFRAYPIILGDNPGGRDGPPLTLSWDYEESDTFSMTDFEDARMPFHRHGEEELDLDAETRRSILERAGYTDEEIKQGEEEADKVRRSRTRCIATTRWRGAAAAAMLISRKATWGKRKTSGNSKK